MASEGAFPVYIPALLSLALHVMALILLGQFRVPIERSFKIYGLSALVLGFKLAHESV